MTSARDNLGPLTTPFTYPSSCTLAVLECPGCTVAWQAQTCSNNVYNPQGVQDNANCWPPPINGNLLSGVAFLGGGFYSPGISCPVGYSTACSATGGGSLGYSFQYPLLASETAIGCCPSGFACSSNNLAGQTCYSVYTTGTFSAVRCSSGETILFDQTVPATVAASATVTGSSNGATLGSLTPATVIQSMMVLAPLFQIIHQPTDLPATTSAPTTMSTPTSTSAGATATSQPGSSLSTGAKAGIGVGAGVGGLILIGMALFLLFRRRKKAEQPSQGVPSGPYELEAEKYRAELPGHTIPVEVDASKPRIAELG